VGSPCLQGVFSLVLSWVERSAWLLIHCQLTDLSLRVAYGLLIVPLSDFKLQTAL
jgi:hypothetical protein